MGRPFLHNCAFWTIKNNLTQYAIVQKCDVVVLVYLNYNNNYIIHEDGNCAQDYFRV